MNTLKCFRLAGVTRRTDLPNHEIANAGLVGVRKKIFLLGWLLVTAGLASGANVPPGVTGLWRFQSSANKLTATLGVDLTSSHPDNSAFFLGPWTVIEPGYSDGGVVQERSFDYLTVNPSFTTNGGGLYVNEYTIAVDFVQTTGPTRWNSLFQTAFGGNDNDGDLWTDPTGHIGSGALGYSTLTYITTNWHRIVWSVANGNFFRVYVDGVLFLDGTPQTIDGRYALYPDKFHLFADNNWEDQWGLVGTVATWNRALTSAEVAGMGGWTNGSATPTPLIFDDTTTNAVPIIASVSPANGTTNVVPDFAYQAVIVDSSTATVDQNSIRLALDGRPVTPTITSALGVITIKYYAGGLLRSGSSHTYTLNFDTTGVVSSITNEVSFQVQNYTGYEWRFTAGDLGAALGNGVMDYADGATTMGLTSFGTTDGSTVPHMGGVPAKYMHVPAFNNDANGYHLTFNATGPNTGTNAYINRYTAIFDLLIPSPIAVSDWLPFFNTDPFNLNDADFYFAGDGSIGIGSGYSSAGTILSNTWYRIVFAADLAANTLTYYVNGTNVKSRAADGVGERWALYSNQDSGPDLLLFNEGDSSGTYTHELYVGSVAFTDRVLSAAEAAALGGPNANGILVRSFSPQPTLSIQSSGGGATVSWPPGYVGYALEQSDTLAAPQWKPVGGITNNAVTLAPSGTATFFRLVQ
jgi:hypothetical protein